MHEISVSPRARGDLIEVWSYTFENWGSARADRYLDDLDRGIRRLAEEPDRGRSRADIRAGYRSIHVGRHVVFYTLSASTVTIRRVLHDQMDGGRHL